MVLPLLLLVLFGMVDLGLLLNRQILLTEAAHEGARAAALAAGPAASADPGTAARDRTAALLGAAPVARTVTGCADGAAQARVDLSWRYRPVTPLGPLLRLFGGDGTGTFTVSATGVTACVG